MTGTLSTTEYVPSSAGGDADDSGTTIVSGGFQYVGDQYGTGSATDTTIYSGGYQYLGSGPGTTGYATSTTISATLDTIYFSGGETEQPIPGYQDVGVDSGTGIATSTSIISGGVQYVGDSYGTGTATGTTISGGQAIYDFMGTLTQNPDSSYQFVGYDNGTGTATGTTILSGGVQIVGDATPYGDDGIGYATSTTIDSGGKQYVGYSYSGGTGYATSTTINSGGVQYVGYGDDVTGMAIDTILSGGSEYSDFAFQYVGYAYSGTGTAISTTIDGGGTQFLGSGFFATGYATSTTLSGSGNTEAGQFLGYDYGVGYATGTIISSGGDQTVGGQSGGIGYATDTTVYSSGYQDLGFGGTGYATGTTISGGEQRVGVSDLGIGYATSTTIDSGVQIVGWNGTGYATSTTIDSGGTQYVGLSGGTGTVTDTTIESGGFQYIGDDSAGYYSTGTAISTLLSGGVEVVSAAGTATDTTVFGGGVADILSGGVADDAVINGGTLQLAAGASIGGPIDFAAASGANGGTLDLTGEGAGFTLTAAISGFAGGGDTAALSDIIDVAGAGPTDHVVWTQNGASGTLQVEDASNNVLESLTLDGTYGQARFVLSDPPASVDQIAYNSSAPCFCAGTRIATANGEVAVEDLRVGDTVLTASGALRAIVWIGQRALDVAKHRWPLEVYPVRVCKGAFGDNLPRRDLWLSPQHAVFVEGVLIPIIHLANGATIKQQRVEKVSYWHVELESHDVLLAENLAAESFLDCGSRAGFANCGGFVELHPTFVPKSWDDACAPLKQDGPEVESLHARLAARALQLGFVRADEPDLHILADGRRISPTRRHEGVFSFTLHEGARAIRLMSRNWRPADEAPSKGDRRQLGVVVTRLELDGCVIDLATLGSGWHEVESEKDRVWRWTDGYARLPPARRVDVTIGQAPFYWIEPAPGETARANAAWA